MIVPSFALLVLAGVLVGSGVYLLLERTLSRIFIGLGLLTHGVNVLLLASGGAAGRPALLGQEDVASMADPLPQAMMLTSIVLSLGTTAFGLTLSYRSWRITGHDEVVDDIEDTLLSRRLTADAAQRIDDEAATGAEDADIDYDEEAADGVPGPDGPAGSADSDEGESASTNGTRPGGGPALVDADEDDKRRGGRP